MLFILTPDSLILPWPLPPETRSAPPATYPYVVGGRWYVGGALPFAFCALPFALFFQMQRGASQKAKRRVQNAKVKPQGKCP